MAFEDDSYFKDISFPTESMADWTFQRLKAWAAGGKVAQIFADDGSQWTYEDLLNHSVHVAAGLQSVGINPGDMVSFVARSSHELCAILLGCIMSDVTVTPSIPELPSNELLQNLLVVKTKFVIVGSPFLSVVQEAVSTLNPQPRIFEVRKFFEDTTTKGTRTDPATFKPVRVEDPKSHVFACLFSSGTSGMQKAVALTDYGTLRSAHAASRFQLKADNGVTINSSQPHWIFWWYSVYRGLVKGWTRIIVDKDSCEDMLGAIHKFKPSTNFASIFSLTSMVEAMDANPSRWDISSIRTIFASGDIIDKAAHERLSNKFKVPVFQEYGSTEAGGMMQSRVDCPIVHGSVGKPLMPLKLVDVQTGKDVTTPNTPGELVAKWPIFREYVNNADATASALDENGWYKMGDIATFDESGNYFIIDRIKTMFKHRRYQVSPSELESIIMRMPGVEDVGVTGKPAELEIGALPTSIVVKSPDSTITEKDVIDYVDKKNLHDAKRLRGGVIFTNEIPRNVNGKIVRAKLKELLNQS